MRRYPVAIFAYVGGNGKGRRREGIRMIVYFHAYHPGGLP